MRIDTATPHHWRKISREPGADAPALNGETEADIAIIGGGFTGLSAALAAAEAGSRTALLEADYIGAGASGRNNGMVVPQHSTANPGAIARALGAAFGARYNAMVAGAAAELFALAARHGIDCDAVQKGWIQPAHSEATLARARTIHAEWKALGAPVTWLDAATLAARLGGPGYLGGWEAHEGGHINPYALTQGLARAAIGAGARIHAKAPVHAILPDGKSWRIEAAGGTVRAANVLIATNALTGTLWPELAKATIPVRLYQTASQPLSANLRGTILVGNVGFTDMRKELRAFHYDRDGRLIGGGRMMLWHHASLRGRNAVRRNLHGSFPALGEIAVDEYWDGVIGVTPDRLPRLMRLAPGVLFCGAYSGRGVALGSALGSRVGRFLAGKTAEADLPLPVTSLRIIPAHGLQVVGARLIRPWHRLLDRRDERAPRKGA
ncbi:MAG: FAD-binding oxidoreductase [Rhodospirillales bacterium]|nr:FAD-binding oxidoreductase [Rhodospirillales bacterium]